MPISVAFDFTFKICFIDLRDRNLFFLQSLYKTAIFMLQKNTHGCQGAVVIPYTLVRKLSLSRPRRFVEIIAARHDSRVGQLFSSRNRQFVGRVYFFCVLVQMVLLPLNVAAMGSPRTFELALKMVPDIQNTVDHFSCHVIDGRFQQHLAGNSC